MKSLRLLSVLGICGALVAGCGSPKSTPSASAIAYLGVYEPGVPESYAPIEHFASLVKSQPNIVSYYSGWWEKFRANFAEQAYRHGASVLVQIDPTAIDLREIADGKFDNYLISYARAVKAYGHRVIIGFGHEMNGRWYSWGWQHTPPNVWVAAWRHVVDVFRHERASNVVWLWTINTITPGSTGPLTEWWPGAGYVTWIGVDGYYHGAGDTFTSVFVPTLEALRKLTNKKILISEVGINREAGQAAKIPGVFAGVRRYHLLGCVWFEVDQSVGSDWRIEGNKNAIAAFIRGMSSQ